MGVGSQFHRNLQILQSITACLAQEVQRAQHPLAGRKPRRDTPWSRQVLVRGEPYYANDVAGIRFAFEDAEKILGLGLGAVINVPVKDGERVLGTLNFLREAGGYRLEHVSEARALTGKAIELLR